jgi:protein-disulfide isomerase-like protein with CxxC motif
VKIKGNCHRCGRTFLAQEVIENGGLCPHDQLPLQPDYAAVMVDALRIAERAGTEFEEALERLADINPAFDIDRDSVLAHAEAEVERLQTGVRTGTKG